MSDNPPKEYPLVTQLKEEIKNLKARIKELEKMVKDLSKVRDSL